MLRDSHEETRGLDVRVIPLPCLLSLTFRDQPQVREECQGIYRRAYIRKNHRPRLRLSSLLIISRSLSLSPNADDG